MAKLGKGDRVVITHNEGPEEGILHDWKSGEIIYVYKRHEEENGMEVLVRLDDGYKVACRRSELRKE